MRGATTSHRSFFFAYLTLRLGERKEFITVKRGVLNGVMQDMAYVLRP